MEVKQVRIRKIKVAQLIIYYCYNKINMFGKEINIVSENIIFAVIRTNTVEENRFEF